MNLKKFQALTQIIGTITLVLLALYGLTGLLNDSASWAAQLMAKAMGRTQNAPLFQWGDSTVPLIINYQAHAKDDEGKALTGYYTMTLRIYDDVIGSTPLWQEEHKRVTVREGYFNLLLGNNEPLTNSLFIHPDRFIGLTVHPYDEMVPRQRFASVPYAMHSYHATKADHASTADNADTVDGMEASEIDIPSGAVMAFNLPSCPERWSELTTAQGRFIVGVGTLVNETYTLGDTGGEAFHQLTIEEMPSHSHDARAMHYEVYGGGRNGASHGANPGQWNTGETGGNQPHENRPPYLALLYCQKD